MSLPLRVDIFPEGTEKDCGLFCSLDSVDLEAMASLERHGDIQQAAIVRAEIVERKRRCLGSIPVADGRECGLLHGHVQIERQI